MRLKASLFAAAFIALSAGAASPVLAQAASATLPGGATSLKETFDDWTVTCVVAEGQKRCALSQQQANQQTRQLVLAVELTPGEGNSVVGTLVMPFGLSIDSGVTLQVDDLPSGAALRFRTCLPVGCLVNLSFDANSLKSLRGGTALKVSATPDGTKEPAAFSVPLRGFSPALDRVQALLK